MTLLWQYVTAFVIRNQLTPSHLRTSRCLKTICSYWRTQFDSVWSSLPRYPAPLDLLAAVATRRFVFVINDYQRLLSEISWVILIDEGRMMQLWKNYLCLLANTMSTFSPYIYLGCTTLSGVLDWHNNLLLWSNKSYVLAARKYLVERFTEFIANSSIIGGHRDSHRDSNVSNVSIAVCRVTAVTVLPQ